MAREYWTLPAQFRPGEVVLDVGCHTGGFCDLAARRGATVIGYEAGVENYALACINLAGHDSVEVRRAAVWRSDLEDTTLQFTPNADIENTGGGSVLCSKLEVNRSAMTHRERDAADAVSPGPHPVASVALDDVLAEVGPVRFLKIDTEGAEFPILLTPRRLDLVAEIAGEYHEFVGHRRARLAAAAQIGDYDWSGELLRGALARAGFTVSLDPPLDGQGLFRATRLDR